MKLQPIVLRYLSPVLLLWINRFVYVNTNSIHDLIATHAHEGAELARAVRVDCRQRHAPVCVHAHARINSSGGWDECAVIGDTLPCVQMCGCAFNGHEPERTM